MEKTRRKKEEYKAGPQDLNVPAQMFLAFCYASQIGDRTIHTDDLQKYFEKIIQEKIKSRFSNPEIRSYVYKSIFPKLVPALKEYSSKLFTNSIPEFALEKEEAILPTEEEIAEIQHIIRSWKKAKMSNEDREKLNIMTERFLDSCITYVYYYRHRKKLESWINQSEIYDAIIVNAPLGIGKTMAISNALRRYKDKSAIIFMPTKKLCSELSGLLSGEDYYCIEGLTPDNCKYYNVITQQYFELDYGKDDICQFCEDKNSCHLRSQYNEARSHRIVITTHAQYPRFIMIPREWRWGRDRARQERRRDYFILDEDIISSNFMEPMEVSLSELMRDLDIFINNDIDFEYPIKEKLIEFRQKVLEVRKSTMIAPIDKDFSPTEEDSNKWGRIRGEVRRNEKIRIRKLGEHYWWAIKHGCVVRVQEPRDQKQMQKIIYLYKPISYDLRLWDVKRNDKARPIHVFFDAIPIIQSVFHNYFPGSRVKHITANIPSLGRLRIHHVANENLSRTTFKQDKEKRLKTLNYLDMIIEKHGVNANYFVIATKDHEKVVVKHFKDKGIYRKVENKPQIGDNGYLVICHYGNQKGINDAKFCNVGILLGTYFMPIECIITSGLPYIQNILTQDERVEDRVVDTVRAGRVYKDRFRILGELDFWRRAIEHEQGMGRTRHLYHDVDFYVVTRDDIKQYLICRDAEYKIDNGGQKIFSQKKRSDSEEEKARQLAERYNRKQGYFSYQQIADDIGVSVRSVQNYFQNDRRIEQIKRGKYTFRS